MSLLLDSQESHFPSVNMIPAGTPTQVQIPCS